MTTPDRARITRYRAMARDLPPTEFMLVTRNAGAGLGAKREPTYETDLGRLEHEWSSENGFFMQLGRGCFASESFERALTALRGMTIDPDALLPRRLVSLLWYIPVFMRWQIGRVHEVGGDLEAYLEATNMITDEVRRLLGAP